MLAMNKIEVEIEIEVAQATKEENSMPFSVHNYSSTNTPEVQSTCNQ